MEQLKYKDKTVLKAGNYFAIYVVTEHDRYKPNFLGFASDDDKRHFENIKISQEWKKLFPKKYSVPLIFKYLGKGKAIELITNKKVTLTPDNYIIESFESNQNFYNRLMGGVITIDAEEDEIRKVNDSIKEEYGNLILNNNLEECVRKAFEHYETNARTYYDKKVATTIYDRALVENMMYDLDDKLKQQKDAKVKQKTLQ